MKRAPIEQRAIDRRTALALSTIADAGLLAVAFLSAGLLPLACRVLLAAVGVVNLLLNAAIVVMWRRHLTDRARLSPEGIP